MAPLEITVTAQMDGTMRQHASTSRSNQWIDSDIANPPDGSQQSAPDPHELLLASWGSCTNMTILLYCQRKGWPLQHVSTTLREIQDKNLTRFEKQIHIEGNLDEAQLARIKQIAEKCPINQLMLNSQVAASELHYTPTEQR